MFEKEITLARRKRVADYIFMVLTEKISVFQAIRNFPQIENDKSLEVAWHALMHYEADEDIRRRDNEYAQAQIDGLEFIAFTLAKGNDLPSNIISAYTDFYKEIPTQKKHGLFDLWGILNKTLNLPPKKR